MTLEPTLFRSCIFLAALTLPIVGCNSSDSAEIQNDAFPIISADNAETLLREVIAIANDDALDAASDNLEPVFSTVENLVDQAISNGMASGNGLTFVSSAAINDGGELSEYTFACDSGGTLVAQAYKDDSVGGPYIDEIRATDACSINDAAYDGYAYKSVSFVRSADLASFENFSVSKANGDSMTLHGEYYDSSPENRGPGNQVSWTDASLLQVENGETTSITGYSSLRMSLLQSAIPDLDDPGTTAVVSFTVSAPWSSGEALDVALDLAYADPEDSVANDTGSYPAQWQTGTLRVTAADGSGLTLSPETGDADTFSVVIDGAPDEPMIFNWADGFQVRCAPYFDCR